MYHRVAEEVCDPWDLCVSPKNFEEQLQWLKQKNAVISLTAFDALLQHQSTLPNKVLLTFDDGYEDCFTIAKPLLEKYQIPATFFITTKNLINKDDNFYYWDVVQKIFLELKNLPSTFLIKLSNGVITIAINEKERLQPDTATISWKVKNSMPFNSRTNAFLTLSLFLTNLKSDSINVVIEQLLQQVNQTAASLQLPLIASQSQITSLQNNSLIDVGVHGISHCMLPVLSSNEQFTKMSKCKLLLEELLGKSVTTIAYPDGCYEAATVEQAKACHFKYAFTTNKKSVNNNLKPMELGRYNIDNTNLEKFSRAVQL